MSVEQDQLRVGVKGMREAPMVPDILWTGSKPITLCPCKMLASKNPFYELDALIHAT